MTLTSRKPSFRQAASFSLESIMPLGSCLEMASEAVRSLTFKSRICALQYPVLHEQPNADQIIIIDAYNIHCNKF
jgi:hypothetical protein